MPNKCKSADKCANGSSYDANCKCHCIKGFSGPSCTQCARKCNTGNFAGKPFVKNGRCQCGCKRGFYTAGSTQCGTKINIGGSSKAVFVPPGKRVSMAYVNSDKAEGLSVGDVFVAVKMGQKPYSR